ncbi:MAG: hypothetical protein OXC99_02975 [Chloroflexi bacterium]|nr:hypothetical protein [Chloroflexota bacterium]
MRPVEKDEAAGGAAKGLRRRRPQEGPGETAPPPPADGGGEEPGPAEDWRLAAARRSVRAASQGATARVSAAGATGKAASATAARVAGRSSGRAASAARATLEKATQAALDLVGTAQGLLASNLAVDLNDLMQGMVKGTATIYDKAMDATYIATHEGGANHRLFDGGHTLSGAFSAGHNASADDGIVQEALGTLRGLLRDGTTTMGLPIVTWNKATFDYVTIVMESSLRVPKEWFYDLNT